MTLKSSDLRWEAERSLLNAPYSPRRIVLIHTAVSLGASLLLALFNFLLSQMISGTGGLSGMGTRSLLQTAQAVVELAVTVLLPFWNIGLIRAAMNWARKESAEPATLLEGFRRFGSVLGVKAMTFLLFVLAAMAVSYVGTALFMFTPFADKLSAVLQPILEESDGAATADLLLSEQALAQIGSAATPLLIFLGVLFAVVLIPLFYRVRFADFAAMDGGRALICMLESFRITKKKAWQIFKIDLSFWWFYLLQALSVALCYGDTILGALGVTLPMSPDVAYFLFFVAGILCQGLLLWRYQAQVSATYAVTYDALCADTPVFSGQPR